MPVFFLRDAQIVAKLKSWLDQNWEREGNAWMVEIAPESSKRTDRQRRYYWASLQDLSEDAPIKYSKEVWHEYFRKLFLPLVELPDGSMVPMSTNHLTVKEANEYLDQINRWTSTEFGIPFGKSPDEFGGF